MKRMITGGVKSVNRCDPALCLPSVLFVTTTNFIEAVDEAFLSRADARP